MRRIELTTYLDAPPDRVWEEVLRPALLLYVSRGVLSFRPLDPPQFPDLWAPGAYRVGVVLLGWLPLGWQIVQIEFPPATPPCRRMRDNGRGWALRRSDHLIEIAPEGAGTRYTDRVEIEAGVLTPLIAAGAGLLFRHRQKRWRRLVAQGFDYAA